MVIQMNRKIIFFCCCWSRIFGIYDETRLALSSASEQGKKLTDKTNNHQKNGQKNQYDKAGKIRKIRSEPKESDSLSANLRTIASVLLIMLLMLFVVHCTWVTSNAYSSPSIVLASYGGDG